MRLVRRAEAPGQTIKLGHRAPASRIDPLAPIIAAISNFKRILLLLELYFPLNLWIYLKTLIREMPTVTFPESAVSEADHCTRQHAYQLPRVKAPLLVYQIAQPVASSNMGLHNSHS